MISLFVVAGVGLFLGIIIGHEHRRAEVLARMAQLDEVEHRLLAEVASMRLGAGIADINDMPDGWDLYERVARTLGWPLAEVVTFDPAALQALVRPLDAKLADALPARRGGQ